MMRRELKTKSGLKLSVTMANGPEISRPLWSAEVITDLRHALAVWYQGAQRDLPWRRTRDPYAITVSEYMLQQTQVITVIPYYERWMTQFPTWDALAAAPEDAVLKAWEGLGYYTRARNLQALARAITERGGRMPETTEGLRALPGIGPYTAAAIGSIAFGRPVAVLDGNVMRVLTRLLAWDDDISKPETQRRLQGVAGLWLDPENPGNHNQAVMELGAMVCVPRGPMCLICPVQRWCCGKDRAEDYPVKKRDTAVERDETVAILREENSGKIYAEQVPSGKPWARLWRFPDFDPTRMEVLAELEPPIRYGITKYRVTMRVVEAKWIGAQELAGKYLNPAQLRDRALAAPHRKLAERVAG